MTGSPAIAVYGATGLAGTALSRALISAGLEVRLVGRSASRLRRAADTLPGHGGLHVAAHDDRGALLSAFLGARVVVNAAGPFALLGDAVVTSAIACGSHYLDVCNEQAVLRHVFEYCDASARHAEVAVVPGAAFWVALGDLLAAAATAQLIDHHDHGPTVRQVAGRRLTGSAPIAISVGYLLDHLTLSPGEQSSLFANLGAPMVAWRRDRWDAQRTGRLQRTFLPGDHAPGDGDASESHESHDDGWRAREAFSIAGGDNLSIPRHVAASSVDTYVSLSGHPATHRALRWVAMATSLLPAAAASLLLPSDPAPHAYGATRFAVVADAEYPLGARQAIAVGRDPHATGTAITARLAMALAHRPTGPFGVLAAAEIVRAPQFLADLADAGIITLTLR
jgi:Saccharopine dehydrogenase NADP binding domain